jgi:hypothetical protein
MRTAEQNLSALQSSPNEAADRILSELDGLAPTIAAYVSEAEASRRIPADIFQKLKLAGSFRMQESDCRHSRTRPQRALHHGQHRPVS